MRPPSFNASQGGGDSAIAVLRQRTKLLSQTQGASTCCATPCLPAGSVGNQRNACCVVDASVHGRADPSTHNGLAGTVTRRRESGRDAACPRKVE